MKTVRLTMAQALVRFLENQYMEVDGAQHRFVRGVFIIPGHGNVVGLGQALSQEAKHLEVYQGKNEQGMAQAAVAFAKQMKRKQICVATSSVGPGAANMVTACGTATANNIPLLVLPGDVYACRQPDPVLQQVEQTNNLSISTNDAFKAVCRYWDRIVRPEQLRVARRLIRDYNTRGHSLRETVERAASVNRGEENYIKPYKSNAAIQIDSFHDYEPCILAKYLLEIPQFRQELTDEFMAENDLTDLMKVVREVPPLHTPYVPLNSIVREFVGGSCYKY